MRSLPSSASIALHCQRGDILKVFKSLQDLTWTALFLAYHQPRPVAGLRQHDLSVRLNQMKMGSEKKWDRAAKEKEPPAAEKLLTAVVFFDMIPEV